LGERCYAVIEANFLGDLAVLNPEDRRAGEVHLSAGSRGQRPGQKITECRTGVRAATFPLTDDIVALCNQVGRAPEVEVRERPAEVPLEGLNVFAATAWFVERILQQHLRCGQFVHDGEIAGLTPKVGEPPANDGLVLFIPCSFGCPFLRRRNVTDLSRRPAK
jgi:hypothetical protein